MAGVKRSVSWYLGWFAFAVLFVLVFLRFDALICGQDTSRLANETLKHLWLSMVACLSMVLAPMKIFFSRDANRVVMACGVTIGLFCVASGLLSQAIDVL
jgi:hypothetical protein